MNKFFKKLDDQLSKFKYAKEWTDLVKNITDIQILMDTNQKELNLNDYPNNEILAKRLAQCLNKDLPGGLHEVSIKLYSFVLHNLASNNNQNLGKNLALFSSGLFPFYQYASAQNKINYLESIIKKVYLCINNTELELCLPGLLVSILPCLDENNEQITKNVIEVFNDISSKIDEKIFYGILWSIILRNPKLRSSGMEYMKKSIPTYDSYKNEDCIEKRLKDKEIYYPNFDILVINTLCSVIQDDDVLIVRSGMDFIIQRFPIYDKDIISDESKIKILISVLKLLIKKEYSTIRRVGTWILNEDLGEDVNINDSKIKYILYLLIEALKRIFYIDKDSPPKNLSKTLTDNIQLIKNFLELQDSLSYGILSQISYDIIKSIIYYWINELNYKDDAYNDEIITTVNSFFSNNFLELLWESLSNNLKGFKVEENNENLIDLLEELVQILEFCNIYIGLTKPDLKVKYYASIISNLLNIISQINVTSKDIGKIKSIISIIHVFTRRLQKTEEEFKDLNNNNDDNSSKDIYNMNNNQNEKNELLNDKFIISQESSFKNISQIDSYSKILEELTKSILQYQKYYISLSKNFLNYNIEEHNLRTSIKVFKQSTEVLIRLQEYSLESEIPDWLFELEKIIFQSNNTLISFEACNFILDLLLSEPNNHTETFIKIQNNLLNENIDRTKLIINEEDLKILLNSTIMKENCFEIIFCWLWNFLDKEEYQKYSVDLLYKIFKINKDKFIDLFSNTFTIHKKPKILEKVIQKFTQFWKLAIEYYPNVIFFEKGECIFKMLDYLEDEYPILRHLSKSWLNQHSNHFPKILNPLIYVFLNKEIEFSLENNTILIKKEYNMKSIIDAFKKLKNLILNVSNINDFIFEKPNPNPLFVNDDKLIGLFPLTLENYDYLFLLINISMRFIKGELQNVTNEDLIEESLSVNSSACEYLELLIKKINDTKILNKIAQIILIPLYYILAQKLGINNENQINKNENKEDKQDEVMQIQILEIIKILIIDTHYEDLNSLIQLFIYDLFIKCLSTGITLNYFYVRRHYILFVEKLIPLIIPLLKEEKDFEKKKTKDELIEKISQKFISETNKFIVKKVKYNEKSIQTNSGNRIFILKNYLDEYKDYKTFEENDIYVILSGLSNIVNLLMDFNKLDLTSPNEMSIKKIKDDSSNKKNNLFFGLFSDNSNDKLNDKDIGSSIYSKHLHDLISIFLICWTNQSELYQSYDYCLNNNGILSYKENKNKNKNQNFNFKKLCSSWNKTTKGVIKDITQKLFLKNPIEFIDNYLNIWSEDFINESNNEQNYPKIIVTKDKLYKLSMIELLHSIDIDLNVILYTITQILKKKYDKNYIKTTYTKGQNKILKTPFNEALFESKLCHFIYSYILLESSIKKKENEKIIDIWKELINILTLLYENSKISHTFCWIYELISLMMDIYPKNDIGNNDIFDNITEFVDNITEKLSNIAFNNKFESNFQIDEYLILPICPSLYTQIVSNRFPNIDYYKIINSSIKINNIKDNENIIRKSSEEVFDNELKLENTKYNNDEFNDRFDYLFYSTYMKTCLMTSSYETREKKSKILFQDLNENYRKIAFFTLKFLFYKIYKSLGKDLYYPFKPMLKNIMNCIENDNDDNYFYTEIATQFLNDLIHYDKAKVCQVSGQNIFEYFSKETFFKTSLTKLRNWKEIIANYSDINKDIINILIKQMDGIFSKKNDSVIVKKLRRISFVIYSSKKDTFEKNFNSIKELIKEFFTDYNNSNEIEKELFLMLRILFLRFNHDNIMEMIRSFWPIIFNELVNNLEKKNKENTKINNEKEELKLESYKFIELLSLANIEEFSLYQWIFIIDTFDMERLNIQNKNSLLQNILNNNQIFRPYSLDCIDDWNDYQEYMKSQNKAKSTLIINIEPKNKNNLKNELIKKIKKFFFSIGDMNNYKGEVNYSNIEEIIEKDFKEEIKK